MCPPWLYAVVGFLSMPLLVVTMLLSILLFMLSWPFMPVIFYLSRKQELKQRSREVRPGG